MLFKVELVSDVIVNYPEEDRKGKMLISSKYVPKGTILDVFQCGIGVEGDRLLVSNEKISIAFMIVPSVFCRPL